MYTSTTRADLLLTLALAGSLAVGGRAAGQVRPDPVVTNPRPPVAPGSFTGARPAVMPGGGLGGSNLGGTPTGPGGGGIVGGPGMPGGVMGTQKSWHCPRCQREVSRGTLPPASANCCVPVFGTGTSPNGGLDTAPPNPAEPALPPTEPPTAAGQVIASSEPAAPAGNGKLVAVGAGIVLTGLGILGVVVFLAVRAHPGLNRPRRRRRVSDYDYDYD